MMTGGSSGNYKEAARQTGIVQFLPPFFSLLRDLHIDSYQSVLIGLPFYHGFGLATLIISLVMGKKICLLRHFDAEKVLNVVAEERVEVMPMVPAMLARLWQTEGAQSRLRSLKCIISGGDRLDVSLARHTWSDWVLCFTTFMARLRLVSLCSPHRNSLSMVMKFRLDDPFEECNAQCGNRWQRVSALVVKCRWAMTGRQNSWQNTGDRVLQLSDGRFLHRGRADRMVVCGGENVYPEHVEKVLKSYPLSCRCLGLCRPRYSLWPCA